MMEIGGLYIARLLIFTDQYFIGLIVVPPPLRGGCATIRVNGRRIRILCHQGVAGRNLPKLPTVCVKSVGETLLTGNELVGDHADINIVPIRCKHVRADSLGGLDIQLQRIVIECTRHFRESQKTKKSISPSVK
jgi:hypothetical protein